MAPVPRQRMTRRAARGPAASPFGCAAAEALRTCHMAASLRTPGPASAAHAVWGRKWADRVCATRAWHMVTASGDLCKQHCPQPHACHPHMSVHTHACTQARKHAGTRAHAYERSDDRMLTCSHMQTSTHTHTEAFTH